MSTLLNDATFLNREYDARATTRAFDKDAIYRHRSLEALKRAERIANITYDGASGSKLDIYPGGQSAPLFVWIHGGYWRSSTKDDNAFVAPGLVAKGIAVANVDYTLAPHATLQEIVRQIRSSIAWLAANGAQYGIDARRIHVGGHSAGGHLVGMLLADNWQSSFNVAPDAIGTALSVSGLFDLAPLRRTFVNDALALDEAAAFENSPINLVPRNADARLLATVGGDESSEFQRQTNEYWTLWSKTGNRGKLVEMPGFHHFNIILELESPGNPLFDTLVASIIG
jgi:arylformamidase